MKHLHLICRREGVSLRNLVLQKDTGLYHSGFWKIDPIEANTLIGGRLFLHETKKSKSRIGGTVQEVLPAPQDGRVIFVFKSESFGKGADWQGQAHSMAWTGGIVGV